MEIKIEIDKTYKTNFKVYRTDLFFMIFLFSLIILFSGLGFTTISFITTVLFFFRAFRIFLKFKNSPAYFKINLSNSNSDFEISFYDSNKQLIINDLLKSFIFYNKRSKIFEVSHDKLKKNLLLILNLDTNLMYQFLKENNIEIKKPKKTYKFWEIVELILMQ
jgi:hypothetical protein